MQIETGKTAGKVTGNTPTWRDELMQLGDSAERHGTKVLRDNLDVINYLVIDRGVSLRQIHTKLKEKGLRLTYKSFIQTLKLVRKEKRNSLASLPTAEGQSQAGTQQPPRKEEEAKHQESSAPYSNPTEEGLVRPPGITPAAWIEMQQKHKAEQRRRQQNLKGITK